MSDWGSYKLVDFININPKIILNKDMNYSFIEMKDLYSNRRYATPSCKKRLIGGSRFCNGDTLFARITPCLENGKICQVKDLENNCGFGSTEFLILRGKEGISDGNFVYYLSRTVFLRNAAIQNMTGTSGRQRVEKSAFEQIEIKAPADLFEQSRIASILSSLDDKIELNLQMNKTLEAIAQAIFKEWFVDFRFPGFDGELVNGLPRGWRKADLNDAVTVKGGSTPSTKDSDFWDGDYYWATPKDLSGLQSPVLLSTERKITESGVKQISSGILPKGTLLLSSRAPIGYLAISQIPISINQGFIAIQGKLVSNLYMLFWLNKNMELIKGRANGSTFQEINKSNFKEIGFIIPNSEVMDGFDKIICPIFERIVSNEKENSALTQIRDNLLPKLMTGKIRVA